jgi:hypothetical protein
MLLLRIEFRSVVCHIIDARAITLITTYKQLNTPPKFIIMLFKFLWQKCVNIADMKIPYPANKEEE